MPLPSMTKVARSGFETPGEMSPEVQNNGISGPTKRTYFFKKISNKTIMTVPSLVLVIILVVFKVWFLISVDQINKTNSNSNV